MGNRNSLALLTFVKGLGFRGLGFRDYRALSLMFGILGCGLGGRYRSMGSLAPPACLPQLGCTDSLSGALALNPKPETLNLKP